MADHRLYAPAFERNADIILACLRSLLPPTGLVLELASGSGEHIVHFARAFKSLVFQPTDYDPAALASIDAWAAHEGATNILPALFLDAASDIWPIDSADAMLCINMVHISPWSATQGLFRHAARILPVGGRLILYGPFKQNGVPLAPSNAAFDADLRARNTEWGLRDLDSVTALAAGFAPPSITEVPANNLVVAYQRLAPASASRSAEPAAAAGGREPQNRRVEII